MKEINPNLRFFLFRSLALLRHRSRIRRSHKAYMVSFFFYCPIQYRSSKIFFFFFQAPSQIGQVQYLQAAVDATIRPPVSAVISSILQVRELVTIRFDSFIRMCYSSHLILDVNFRTYMQSVQRGLQYIRRKNLAEELSSKVNDYIFIMA